MGGKCSAVSGLVMVPVAAALLALEAPLAMADPGLPAIDQIFSGSAAPGTTAEPGAEQAGRELGLGSSLGPATTGSSAGEALGIGSTTPGAGDTVRMAIDPTVVEPSAADPGPGTTPGTLGGLLLDDPDIVLPACVGSAAVGSAALGSGIATGSGFGSGLVGLGSSGIVGSGSAGAGSVAVGSAATGSALLTCMLLLPVPALPELAVPLGIPPSAIEPAVVPGPVRLPEVIPSILAAVPPQVPPPPRADYAAPDRPEPAPALTALQVMTVMIITIIAGARARLRGR